MGEKWEFPGGKVESGERDEAALEREYFEEFAVGVRVGCKLAGAVFEHKGDPVVLSAYAVELLSKDFVLSEHTEWDWASFADIERLDFADSDLKLIPELKALGTID